MFFKKKTKKIRAIKLYSLCRDQEGIERIVLVESVLRVFETLFHEMPTGFDISGPYGISKGKTIGLATFKRKLERIGHEKYYGLYGATEEKFGFRLLFNAKLEQLTYTELIFWYPKDEWKIDFKQLVRIVMDAFSLSCAYEIEIDEGFDIGVEKKIKRGLFGGVSLEISYDHLRWILGAKDGAIRAVFDHNIWNEKQLRNLHKNCVGINYEPLGNLFYASKDT